MRVNIFPMWLETNVDDRPPNCVRVFVVFGSTGSVFREDYERERDFPT